MQLSDDTLTTARVPVGELRDAARLPESNLAPADAAVSVTQAIRVRRSRRRAPGQHTSGYASARTVTPSADAIFPAVVSLAVSIPLAAHAWDTFPTMFLIAVPVLVFAATFGVAWNISRRLDQP